jgi:hypothetical protein
VQVTHPLSRGIELVISLHAEPRTRIGLNVPGEQEAYARRWSFRHSGCPSYVTDDDWVRTDHVDTGVQLTLGVRDH